MTFSWAFRLTSASQHSLPRRATRTFQSFRLGGNWEEALASHDLQAASHRCRPLSSGCGSYVQRSSMRLQSFLTGQGGSSVGRLAAGQRFRVSSSKIKGDGSDQPDFRERQFDLMG